MRRPWAAAILLAICWTLTGCAGSGPESSGPPPPPACKPPKQPTISFASNIQPFFNASCAVAGCHVGPVPTGQLDLSEGRAYGQTVNVKAAGSRLLRIKPGSPEQSYVVQKIQGTPGIAGTIMPPPGCPAPPQNGAACPSDGDKAALNQWITECAPNN